MQQSDCAAPAKWVTRAKTKEECINRGNQCVFEDGNRNSMSAAQCNDCGGKSIPTYRWSYVIYKLT